jgi:hypothetical protein
MAYAPMRTRGPDYRASSASDVSLRARPPQGQVEPSTRLELAAGAKINQLVYRDPMSLDFWQDQPAGIIVINYTDEKTALEVISRGEDEAAEGPLAELGIKLGHHAS